jgi:hypothetical protein
MAIITARRTRFPLMLITAAALVAGSAVLGSQGRKFYDDDPIAREPETQDASKVQAWTNVLTYDLALNSFATPGSRDRVRAGNVNTIDEVPDSSWFTNRILTRAISREEVIQGPVTQPGPAPGPWTVHRAKPEGVSPGFRVLDAAGVEWFIQFDARGYPAAASGASIVANRIFHALGYFQVEQHIAELDRETLTIGPEATTETPSGKVRRLDWDDLDKLFAKAARQPNGKYRVLAGRRLPGRIIGGFRYAGTRPDDPNDIVPHEHRRELRALKVFGAWTNLVDMKAGNTLDTVISENGRARVRHYLQDTGSTFGTGALGPHQWDEGYEYYYEPDFAWKRLVSFGFYRRPWQTVPYEHHREIGPFEGDAFDPTAWRPRTPTGAFLNARADDTFWAARRVMAFSDELIRAVVTVAQYTDPAAERYLADVLIKRRDAIARTYLNAVNPVIDAALAADGTLTFANAAVDARVAKEPSGGYRAEWGVFDNTTRETQSLGAPTTASAGRMVAPSPLPTTAGAFVHIRISASDPQHPSWAIPVDVYFRRTATGWILVGFERIPDRI